MSKTLQPLSFSILDKEYRIACAEDEQQQLLLSAIELDKQMRQIRDTGKVNGADRIAVLAALNLLHIVNTEPPKADTADENLLKRINGMRLKIENVLENP